MTSPPAASDELSGMTEKCGGKALFSTVKNGHVNKVGLCNKHASRSQTPHGQNPAPEPKLWDHSETKPVPAKMLTD